MKSSILDVWEPLENILFQSNSVFQVTLLLVLKKFLLNGNVAYQYRSGKNNTSLVGEYYFNVNNKGRRTPAKVGLVFLLLTLNRFYTLFCCLRSLLWASKCGLGTGFVDYFEQIFVFFLFLKCYILSSPYNKPSIDLQSMISIWQQHWTLIWFNYTVSNNQY